MEFRLIQNLKENCHHDLIPFNLKKNGNIVFSVYYADRLGVSKISSSLSSYTPLTQCLTAKHLILFISAVEYGVREVQS